jgi:hypothetical protein
VARGPSTPSSKEEVPIMAKILCVLYPDPVNGYPPKYARHDIPTLHHYPDGTTLPRPSGIDLTPGEPLGCVSEKLGLRRYLETAGHTQVIDIRQGGHELDFREGTRRRRRRHLSALLAGLLDRGTDREKHRISISPSRRGSDRTMSISTLLSRDGSRSPRSPGATASACQSTPS